MGVSFKKSGVVNITHFTEKCMENVGFSSAGGCFEFIIMLHSKLSHQFGRKGKENLISPLISSPCRSEGV